MIQQSNYILENLSIVLLNSVINLWISLPPDRIDFGFFTKFKRSIELISLSSFAVILFISAPSLAS